MAVPQCRLCRENMAESNHNTSNMIERALVSMGTVTVTRWMSLKKVRRGWIGLEVGEEVRRCHKSWVAPHLWDQQGPGSANGLVDLCTPDQK